MTSPRKLSQPLLTQKEAAELEKALGDGFVSYGDLVGVHPIKFWIDDPFFETVVRGTGHEDGLATLPDFLSEMASEGYTEDEITDAYREYLDDHVPKDAPHWRETNPFGFDLPALREFFTARYREHYGSDDPTYPDGEPYWPGAFLISEKPYTKIWFELLALTEIGQLDTSKYLAKSGH